MKNTALYIACSMILLSCSFNFKINETGLEVNWLWENYVQIPFILILIALVAVGIHFYKLRVDNSN